MPKIRIKRIPQAQNGFKVEGDQFKHLSPDTVLIGGNSHANNGTLINYNGNVVEAEAGEPAAVNNQGDLVIFGNLKNPATGNKFKTDAKRIAEEEAKASKMSSKANDLVEISDPMDAYQNLTYNSGLVMEDAARINKNLALIEKEELGQLQQLMLDTSSNLNIDPNNLVKYLQGGKVPKLKNGGKIEKAANGKTLNPQKNPEDRNYIVNAARLTALRYGIDPETFVKSLTVESSLNPKAESPKGALGIAQFMPRTAEAFGLTPDKLKSNKAEDIEAQIDASAKYVFQLKKKYNGDEGLAYMAYNRGPGNIDRDLRSVAAKTGRPVDELSYVELATDYENAGSKRGVNKTENLNHIKKLMNVPGIGETSTATNIPPDQATTTPPPTLASPITPAGEPDPNYNPQLIGNPQVPNYNDTFRPVAINQIASEMTDPILNRPVNLDTPTSTGTTPTQQQQGPIPSGITPLRSNLGPLDFMGEAMAIFDRPNFVQGQQYNPQLLTPYQISLQDQINQNTSTFNAVAQQVNNNPAALSTLAGQRYAADQQVLGNQFRTNQGISNQIANQNNQIMNQAQLQNIQLADTQYTRQEQARANTDQNRRAALSSVASKIGQNRLLNNEYAQTEQRTRLMENFFNYRPDQDQNLTNYNVTDFGGTPAQQPVQEPTDPKENAAYWKNYGLKQEALRKQMQNEQTRRRQGASLFNLLK